MGVTLLTALIIQTNDIYVETHESEGLFGFRLYRLESGYKYRPEITCEALFETKKLAKKAGKDLIKEIRNLDLSK